jgi:hypothetical protein
MVKVQLDVYDCGTEKIVVENLTSLLKMGKEKVLTRWKYIIGGTFVITPDEEHKFILRLPATELRLNLQPELEEGTDKIRLKYQTILDMNKEDLFFNYAGNPILKSEDPWVVSGITIRGGTGQQVGTAPYILVLQISLTKIPGVKKKGYVPTPQLKPIVSQPAETKLLKENVNTAATSTQTKLDLVLTYIYQKKYDLAISLCEEILKTEMTNVTACERLGSAYFSLGELDKAKTVWLRALNINPDNKVLHQFIERIDKLQSR